MGMDVLVTSQNTKESKHHSRHNVKLKNKNQLSGRSALSRLPPNASRSNLPEHGIDLPDSLKDHGNRLWSMVQAEPQSPGNWWHWLHFLHLRCKGEPIQLLDICQNALTHIDTTKYMHDDLYAKILLVQCKFLYTLQKYSAALDIYKAMLSNNIGHSLYYFWVNYATLLHKTNNSKKSVKLLHTALSSVSFKEDDEKKIQSALDSILHDIVTSPKQKSSNHRDNSDNIHTVPSTPIVKNHIKNEHKSSFNTPDIRPSTSSKETPVGLKYTPLNETPLSVTRNRKRTLNLNPFPSKFQSGPERIRKSSGSESNSSLDEAVANVTLNDDKHSNSSIEINDNADEFPLPNVENKAKKTLSELPPAPLTPESVVDEVNVNDNKDSHVKKSSKKTFLSPRSTTPKKKVKIPLPSPKQVKKKPQYTPKEKQKSNDTPKIPDGLKLQELIVTGKKYQVLGIMGKGGSSRVLKAIGGRKNDIFAIKQVDLSDQDEQTCEGFRNEVGLLQSLKGQPNVVQLYDYEITDKRLSLVLELGEIDLRHLLHRLKKSPSKNQINYIKLYWQQMLEAVQVIHTKRIVHGDLKPANFVSFKGVLKLIDFGIAGAIQSNTTNIKRDSMIGTLNYIAPEALDLSPNPEIRMGVASDVWSMGIILYEMAYHTTPFASITNMFHKVQSIVNDKVVLTFDDIGQPLLVETLKACLQRNPKARPTIAELLESPFLK